MVCRKNDRKKKRQSRAGGPGEDRVVRDDLAEGPTKEQRRAGREVGSRGHLGRRRQRNSQCSSQWAENVPALENSYSDSPGQAAQWTGASSLAPKCRGLDPRVPRQGTYRRQ